MSVVSCQLSVSENFEFFFVARGVVSGVFGVAGAHTFGQFFRLANLAFVFQQGADFGFPGGGHVEAGVGLAGERNPNFGGAVWLKAFAFEFREEEFVSGGGEDGVEAACPAARWSG